MSVITTVLGDIESRALGFCQSHEHLFIAQGQSAAVNSDLCLDDARQSANELALYYAAGGRAVVDAQPLGCGRDAQALAAISRESGVHIIGSTGFHKLLFYQPGHWIFEASEETLTEIFISELTEGMYALCDTVAPQERTAYRAGQIKAALDIRFTDDYEKLFSVAANAAQQTGRPLMAHIEAGADPAALADFLMRKGVRPQQLIFCHMDRAIADLSLHREMAARGLTLEYDTIARPKYHSDEREIEILRHMLEAGYEEQILMSLDSTRARLKSYGGHVGLDYILNEFVKTLDLAGIPQRVIEKIFVDNPARMYGQ